MGQGLQRNNRDTGELEVKAKLKTILKVIGIVVFLYLVWVTGNILARDMGYYSFNIWIY